MIRLADKLYGDKRRSMGIPLGIAATAFVLALLFGNRAMVYGGVFVAPFTGLLAFGGMFLVMGIQLINPFCPPGFMDFGELFFGLCFCVSSCVWFVTTGFWQLFGETAAEAVMYIFTVTGFWCGLCVIHGMRY